ncbi:hypothetical protein L208DRAFT_1411247 [Tricholoma matsutake]|nr:hypothetical protein L208DRAFT_1411247 [Tricholoma matsutake 945]
MIYRTLSASYRLLSRSSYSRQFHSPFVVLKDNSPLTSPPASTSSASVSPVYEKQFDSSPEPVHSPSGRRTYVVSEPDTSSKFYSVPSGAYPTSAPYVNFAPTEAPDTHGAQVSSTSSTPLAHKQTIRTVPQHKTGVGQSAAVRHAEAPSEMGKRGGSHGGLGLMDKKGTLPAELPGMESNPPPLGAVGEAFGRKGLDGAWNRRR